MPELIVEAFLGDSNHSAGWLVIDSTIHGRSHGGLRISPNVSREELCMLAHRMTLKFGFLGISSGGAKAGIVGDPEAPAEIREEMLKRFAEKISPIVKTKLFLPHADIGTTQSEIEQVFDRKGPRQPTREESGFYTSVSVGSAAKIAAGRIGKQLPEITVAIEGFGKVGSSVAKLLAALGAKIVGVSTSRGALYRKEGLDIEELFTAQMQSGSKFVLDYTNADKITQQEMLSLPVDLLSPCANTGSIHAENAEQIHAKIICAGGNCPLTPQAEANLTARGVLCLPDYLTNSGGILGGTMAFAGISMAQIPTLMGQYLEPRFATLFELPNQQVENKCLDRFYKMKDDTERNSFKNRLFQTGLNLYRNGLVPKFLTRRLAPRYFLSR
jgi:glutamate dehydrogenase (NAD(P)+)